MPHQMSPPPPFEYALPSEDYGLASTDVATNDGRGNVGLAFGLVVAAGGATVIGAGLAFFVKQTNHLFMAASLGFSAGVMLYVSFVEIFTRKTIEGFEQAGFSYGKSFQYASLSFFGGMLMTWLLDLFCHALIHLQEYVMTRRAMQKEGLENSAKGSTLSIGSKRFDADLEMAGGTRMHASNGGFADSQSAASDEMATVTLQLDTVSEQPRQHSRHNHNQKSHRHGVIGLNDIEVAECEHCANDDVAPRSTEEPKEVTDGVAQILANDNHFALKKMGLLTCVAITVHNIPEGLATYIGTLADPTAGVAIAVAIALHNIPEGIVIAMPIYLATGSKWKAFFWASMSGLAEPIGGIIGYLALSGSDLDPLAYALLFGIVAGMMTWISIRELIPTALRYDPQDRVATLGVLGGFIIMAVSLILFTV